MCVCQSGEKSVKAVECFLLGNSPASEFSMPTFRNTLSVPSSKAGWYEVYLPAYEIGRDCSETLAYKIQTPGNYPEESIKHAEHGENLKSVEASSLFTTLNQQTAQTCSLYSYAIITQLTLLHFSVGRGASSWNQTEEILLIWFSAINVSHNSDQIIHYLCPFQFNGHCKCSNISMPSMIDISTELNQLLCAF